MKKMSFLFILGLVLHLTMGVARAGNPALAAGDPNLAKVGGVYFGEKLAALLQSYFNAVAPYTPAKSSAYEAEAPLNAVIVYDPKAQVIRVTLIGTSASQQSKAAINAARNIIFPIPTAGMYPQFNATQLVQDTFGYQLTAADVEFQFYDIKNDNLQKASTGGGLFGKGGIFGGNGK